MSLLLAIAAAAVAAGTAAAARPPTPVERSNIRAAMIAGYGIPAPCVHVKARVSTVDRRYAVATQGKMTGSCARYASNGDTILRDRGGDYWVSIWDGSTMIRCVKTIPVMVVRDLLGYRCRS